MPPLHPLLARGPAGGGGAQAGPATQIFRADHDSQTQRHKRSSPAPPARALQPPSPPPPDPPSPPVRPAPARARARARLWAQSGARATSFVRAGPPHTGRRRHCQGMCTAAAAAPPESSRDEWNRNDRLHVRLCPQPPPSPPPPNPPPPPPPINVQAHTGRMRRRGSERRACGPCALGRTACGCCCRPHITHPGPRPLPRISAAQRLTYGCP